MGAVAKGEESLPAEEAGAALANNLTRQRRIAAGERVVNTQGRDAVALDDENPVEDEGPNWMA